MVIGAGLLTSSTSKYESHDREDRLQLTSFHYPYNGNNDYGDGKKYGYNSKFFSPKSLLKFEPNFRSMLPGFEICEPIDPLTFAVYMVRVDKSMHECMISRVVFFGYGVGDVVRGSILWE